MGLLAYHPLQDGTGTSAVDLSGAGRTGTLRGTAAWVDDSTTEQRPALKFDGTSDGVMTVEDDVTLDGISSVTVAMWMYHSAMPGPSVEWYLVSRRSPTYFQYSLYLNQYGWQFAITDGAGTVLYCGTGVPSTSTWYHLAIVYSAAGGGIVYINGNSAGSFASNGNGLQGATSGSKYVFGGQAAASGYTGSFVFNGQATDHRIYDSAESQSSIIDMMEDRKPVKTRPLAMRNLNVHRM